jgi:hypothetical protein
MALSKRWCVIKRRHTVFFFETSFFLQGLRTSSSSAVNTVFLLKKIRKIVRHHQAPSRCVRTGEKAPFRAKGRFFASSSRSDSSFFFSRRESSQGSFATGNGSDSLLFSIFFSVFSLCSGSRVKEASPQQHQAVEVIQNAENSNSVSNIPGSWLRG